MAVTLQTRTQLPQWSAGTDPFTRAQMNAAFLALEQSTVMFSQGLASGRPAVGVQGRFYYQTDGTPTLWYDNGSTWVSSTPPTVGGTSPTAETFGAASAEGASAAAARVDHVHGMPATPVTALAVAGGGISTSGATGSITITVVDTNTTATARQFARLFMTGVL